MLLLFAPDDDINTYTLAPACRAAFARVRLRSRSIALCAAGPPAMPRVVPSADMKIEGGGDSREISTGHVLESEEMTAWKFESGDVSCVGSGRRLKACIVEDGDR